MLIFLYIFATLIWIGFLYCIGYLTIDYYKAKMSFKKAFKSGQITKDEYDIYMGKKKPYIIMPEKEIKSVCTNPPFLHQYIVNEKLIILCNFKCDGNCHLKKFTNEELMHKLKKKLLNEYY